MAFQIFWKVQFKSLRSGTVYTVNIYKDGTLPSGYPLTLKGGAQPFTTEEDDDEDMFRPVRTQTGYVRIVDDGKAVNDANAEVSWDWKELIPDTDLSRPVTLTTGNTVVWQGYMQAQTFGSTLYGNPQEREFPVQCPLSSLSASDIDSTERELHNFAYVIKEAFGTLVGLKFDNYIFQGGESARSWLMKLIDWQNYITSSDDGLTGKYDHLRIIDDICKYWGWTCRMSGRNVLFSCVDDTTLPGVLTLTQTELNTLAGGKLAGTVGESFLSAVSMSGNIFASTANRDYLVRGFSKATVSADGNPAETKVVGFAPDSVEKAMKGRGTYTETDGNKMVYYTTDLLTFDSYYLTGECRSGYASFNIADRRESAAVESSNGSSVIRIKKSFSSTSATAYASLVTKFHHSYYSNVSGQGSIFLKGNIYRKATQLEDKTEAGIGKKTMYMRFGIGKTRATAKWWDGNAWSSSVSAFKVAIGGDGDELLCRVDYNGGQGHGNGSSYGYIKTHEQGMTGLLFVEFLGSDDLDEVSGERSFDVSSFSVEFVRETSWTLPTENGVKRGQATFGGARRVKVIERAGVRDYVAKNQSKVRSGWNADCIYSADNDMEFGYGVIMNADGSWMGKQTYNGADAWPEQHLADRVASYWGASKRKIEVELRSNTVSSVTPRNTVTFDSTTCWPISIGYDWRDDVMKLTLLEI